MKNHMHSNQTDKVGLGKLKVKKACVGTATHRLSASHTYKDYLSSISIGGEAVQNRLQR